MIYIALAASLAALAPPPPPPPPGPTASASVDAPVRVSLSSTRLALGAKDKVKVKTAADGYLVVLQQDESGLVRVIYPVDPDDANTVRGGKEFEIRSRGDREAITVGTRTGSGAVLAAWSATPFDFSAFQSNGHWVVDSLNAQKGRDDESTLTGVVDRMTGGHYEYDIQRYTVGVPNPPRVYTRPYFSGPYFGWYDPFYFGAFGPWPYYYGPSFGFGARIVVPFRSAPRVRVPRVRVPRIRGRGRGR